MNKFAHLGLALCFLSVAAYAETFAGKLVDASCIDKEHAGQPAAKVKDKAAEACAPTGASTSFAIRTAAGKVYRLDSDGNEKAAAAMQSGTLKSDNDGDVHVSISGSMQGETLKVTSITGGKGHKE